MTGKSSPCVLALDIGTSSVRAALYDEAGEALPDAACSLPQTVHTTADGGAEMRAEDVINRAVTCAAGALTHLDRQTQRIRAVAVCTYWHSTLGVDARGRAATPVYLWSDTRSVAEVEWLRERLDARALHRRTGCPLHTSYVAPKILWVAHSQPRRFRHCRRWLSIGEYLFLRLFGETRCSYSMASATGMFDQTRRQWDPALLAVLPINPDQLAAPVERKDSCRGLRPEFAARLPELRSVPWFPALGDGACSNVGCGAVSPERVAVMIGTSGAMRVLCDSNRPAPPEGLWTYMLDGKRCLQGGALSNGGNLYTWLAKTLRVGRRQHLDEQLACMDPDAHGLTVLPFLMGERSPGWRGDARAAIVGLSAHTQPVDIVRAGLEAVAYRFALIYERLGKCALPTGGSRQVIATGGALLHSPAWLQILSDVLNEPVIVSREPQASERGAALAALETLGLLPSLAEARFPFGESYQPSGERHARYLDGLARHRELYRRLLD